MTTRVKRQSSARKPARAAQARRPRASIDPRIRERRVAVVRAQGRRRLRWLVVAVVLGILVAAALVVTHSGLLDVDRVRVAATQHVAADDIRRVSGVHKGDPILFVDAGAVEQRVERLPWVDRASVKRRLPGELDIGVTERSPAAWARAPDRVALVDGRGRVLADTAEPPAELPELGGLTTLPPPGGQIAPRAAATVVEKLPAELRGRLEHVAAGEGGDVTLVLRDGPEVRLGSPDHVLAKARAAVAVLGTITGAPPAYVDVHVPSAPVTG